MKRLTTDTPSTNFETVLNFVYGKDGWAYIRDGGEGSEVLLTQWAKEHCLLRGCDELKEYTTQEEIDEAIGDCSMDFTDCPIALAYTFACQTVHLRSRLKTYEDVLYDGEGREVISLEQLKDLAAHSSNDPLTLEELKAVSEDGPIFVWTVCVDEDGTLYDDGEWQLFDGCCFINGSTEDYLSNYGEKFVAFRRKPEEGTS